QSRAAPARKEWLEDPVPMLVGDSRAAVGNLEERTRDTAHASVTDLNALHCVIPDGVLERVLAKVPGDLAQLGGVGSHFQVARCPTQSETRSRPLHGFAELLVELLEPQAERQALDARFLASRQALHVLDDPAHPLGVAADDLRQALVLAREA